MRRLISRALLSLLIYFSTYLPICAGGITPSLQSVLQTAGPDEEISIIIHLADKVDLSLIRDADREVRRERIVKALKEQAEMTQAPLKALLQRRDPKRMVPLWVINGVAVTVPARIITQLENFPGVESIALDRILQAPPLTLAAGSSPEWNLAQIKAPELWNIGLVGTGVVVANLDTGVDIFHPDLASKWRGGGNSWYNPYSDPANAQYCMTPGHCTPCELSSTPCDADGHGTGTMGIMVGGSAAGTAIGVAPDAKWVAVKIYSDAPVPQAPLSVVHQGFQWILNPDGNATTKDAPNVVNISWDLDPENGCDLTFQPDIQALKAAGIAVVAAAGNSGPDPATSVSPANNAGVFAAGATDNQNNIAPFSSRGPSACDGSIFPAVVAPGVSLKTADLTFGGLFPNSYMTVSGTSFSAPHAAGALALLMANFSHSSLGDLQLLELALRQSAQDLGVFGPDNVYGYGLIDVQDAYELLLNPRPVIVASPMSQNFGNIQINTLSSAQEFTVLNKGLTDLVIGAASIGGADAPQFVRQGDACSGQTLGPSVSCQVHVVFAPGSSGAKNAILLISSNDPATPNLIVPLNGIANLSTTKLGIFRQGAWYLDFNGNGFWDGCGTDTCFGSFGGFPTDRPITGNWSGMGTINVGIYRNGSWYLDANGNGAWDGCGTDSCFPSFGGLPEDLPITGDWDGSGITKIGIYRNGAWFLDRNGNGRWDGCGTTVDTDICFPAFGGYNMDVPVAGDWDGSGITKIGIYRNGAWYLDRNGNGRWDGCGTAADTDICFPAFGGFNIDIPVVGDWSGDGITKVGIYRSGAWYLDRNGNGVWDGCGTTPDMDICHAAFGGFPEDKPVLGKW